MHLLDWLPWQYSPFLLGPWYDLWLNRALGCIVHVHNTLLQIRTVIHEFCLSFPSPFSLLRWRNSGPCITTSCIPVSSPTTATTTSSRREFGRCGKMLPINMWALCQCLSNLPCILCNLEVALPKLRIFELCTVLNRDRGSIVHMWLACLWSRWWKARNVFEEYFGGLGKTCLDVLRVTLSRRIMYHIARKFHLYKTLFNFMKVSHK